MHQLDYVHATESLARTFTSLTAEAKRNTDEDNQSYYDCACGAQRAWRKMFTDQLMHEDDERIQLMTEGMPGVDVEAKATGALPR